mmetsp:Transcript_10482/g.42379  ORF Transcript_10482/g.42379 Transcript_10482/m.42379 type:complete len:231 (+) Transcript_10482:2106-2798(+)
MCSEAARSRVHLTSTRIAAASTPTARPTTSRSSSLCSTECSRRRRRVIPTASRRSSSSAKSTCATKPPTLGRASRASSRRSRRRDTRTSSGRRCAISRLSTPKSRPTSSTRRLRRLPICRRGALWWSARCPRMPSSGASPRPGSARSPFPRKGTNNSNQRSTSPTPARGRRRRWACAFRVPQCAASSASTRQRKMTDVHRPRRRVASRLRQWRSTTPRRPRRRRRSRRLR